MRNSYISGDWNAICDRCGFKYKASELKQEWTGFMVCCTCFETRHPQTLINVPEDDPSVPWARPEPADRFITVPYIDPSIGHQT
jgi:hypothetical protein